MMPQLLTGGGSRSRRVSAVAGVRRAGRRLAVLQLGLLPARCCDMATAAEAAGAAATAAAARRTTCSTLNPNWQAEWEAGFFSEAGQGFHQAEPNVHLVTYADKLLAACSAGRVLVPLCGKTVDMPYLAARGAAVVGIEAVPRPVAEFFAESADGMQPSTKAVGEFTAHYTADAALEIWLGDFFQLEAGTAGAFSAVWDRGALVALEPELHERYVSTIRGVLEPRAKILLSVLTHPPFPDGRVDSPYSVTQEDVQRLYGEYFEVQPLPPIEGLEHQVLPDGTVLTELDYLLSLLA